jgi:hypothetical protein
MGIPFLYKHDGVTELLFHRRGGIDVCGTTELMNAVKVMPTWQLGLPKAARSRIEREIEPQGLNRVRKNVEQRAKTVPSAAKAGHNYNHLRTA